MHCIMDRMEEQTAWSMLATSSIITLCQPLRIKLMGNMHIYTITFLISYYILYVTLIKSCYVSL